PRALSGSRLRVCYTAVHGRDRGRLRARAARPRGVSPLDALADAWRAAPSVVVLTGAGLSTASGIPDFRSPGGRWARYRPVPIQEFLATEEARARYWRYKGETWEGISAAQPNLAHVALAELVAADRISVLV